MQKKTFLKEIIFAQGCYEINWKNDVDKNIKTEIFSNNKVIGIIEFTPIIFSPNPDSSIKEMFSGSFSFKRFKGINPSAAVNWINKNKDCIDVINASNWGAANRSFCTTETIVYFKKK